MSTDLELIASRHLWLTLGLREKTYEFPVDYNSGKGFSPDDLAASFFQNIGIRHDMEFESNVGRPIILVRNGNPIRALF